MHLLGPALLVVVVLRMRDARAAFATLLAADLGPLALALLLNVAVLWFKVLRWDVLLASSGKRLGRVRAWTSFLATVYVGLMTPGRVGDALRAQYLRHDLGMAYSEGIALVLIDRLCDLYVLLGFVAVGMARFSAILVGDLALVTWAGVALIAFGPLVFFVPGVAERLLGGLWGKLRGDPTDKGLALFLAALRGQPARRLLEAVILSLLALLANYLQGFLLARALHLDIGFIDVSCLLAVASLLGLLPVSVSGVGVRELFFSLVFPALGHSPEMGVLFGLGVFLVLYVAVAVMGVVSWHLAPPPFGEPEESARVG